MNAGSVSGKELSYSQITKQLGCPVLLLCGPVPAPKLREPRALRFQRAIFIYRCLFKSLVELQYFNDIVGFWQGVLELFDL